MLLLLFLCSLSAQVPKSGPIVTAILGETMASETWVYISSVDGEAYKADGTNRAKYAHGLVLVGGSAGDTTQVFLQGLNPWESSMLNTTNVYYLSTTTPGTMTDVRPIGQGYIQALCVAMSDTSIVVNPLPFITNGGNGVYDMTAASPQTAVLNVDNMVEPASPTSSYTIDLPDAINGDFVSLVFNASITTVSVTSDVSIVGTSLTTAVPGTTATYKYFATPDVWIRIK